MASFLTLRVHARADKGAREGRYGLTRGLILVHVSGLLWVWNHEPYQLG